MRRALFSFMVACGARTPTAMGTHLDASVVDSGVPISPVSCTWQLVGSPERVSADPTEVMGDVALQDATITTGGALAVWTTPGDLVHAQTAVARRLAFDLGSNGDEHVVLRSPDVVAPLAGVLLASGLGHASVVAWDGADAIARAITVDGASNGNMVVVGPRRTFSMRSSPSGFDLVASDMPASPANVVLERLDASAHVVVLGGTPLEIGQADVARGATLDDGTFIATAVLGPTTNASVSARRFDALGAAHGALQDVWTGSVVSQSLSIAKTFSGATVAWIEPGASAGRVRAVPLDFDAKPRRGPEPIALGATFVTAIHAAADITGGALIGWVEYGPMPTSANVVQLSELGEPTQRPMRIPDPIPGALYAPSIRIVTAGRSGLVFFEVRSNTMLHRVYAERLECD